MRSLARTLIIPPLAALAVMGSAAALAQSANDEGPAPDPDSAAPGDFSDIEAARKAEEADAQRAESSDANGSENAESVAPNVPPQEQEVAPERLETLNRIAQVVAAIDPDAERQGNNWELTIEDTQLLVVTDVTNGRMRIMTPVASADVLPAEALMRLMQANFDSALDARYAIAQNLVWGTFIHSLDDLTTREIASGLLQTKSLRDTFGTTFSSGAMSFGGGDSNAIIADQLEDLLEQLERNNTI